MADDNPFADLIPEEDPFADLVPEQPKTRSEQVMRDFRATNLFNATPTDIGKSVVGLGEAAVSAAGGLGTLAASGIAGIGSFGASAQNRAIESVLGATGKISTPAETVESVQSAGRELFAPRTEAGQVAEEGLAAGVEKAGQAIKFPLSAVPFALGGSEERQEFIETPIGDYLGELAQDNGASPLFATLASITPDIALIAAGGAATKIKGTPKRQNIPTVDELKSQAKSLYDLVDESGVRISDDSFRSAVDDITRDALSKGGRQSLTPRTFAALDELSKEAATGGLTLNKAEELRRVIKKAQNATDSADLASATRALRKWDDYIENLAKKDLSEVTGPETIQFLKSARGLWSRARKTEIVEDMIDTAQLNAGMFSGSGYENALRTQFRALARKKKQMRMFTKVEQEAIRRVATGGSVENIMRFLGKAAPTSIVSAGLGSGGGFFVGGPVGAFLVPAVGGISRRLATRSTVKNAQRASETMRLGRSPETK